MTQAFVVVVHYLPSYHSYDFQIRHILGQNEGLM